MSILCHTPTHKVEHVRRGLYRLVIFGRCPNPNGRHLIAWVRGNRRRAIGRAEQLAALPPSFRGSGLPLPPATA
jgi:hypothetical protein